MQRWAVNANARSQVFAACFGRKHIGAISSFNRSVQIMGTSVGPVSLALVRDAFGAGAITQRIFGAFGLNISLHFFKVQDFSSL